MQINHLIEQYIVNHSTKEPELLNNLRKETYQKTIQPHMISGVLQGRLLSMISKIINPKSILEIGTFTGYSGLCLSEGLQNKGELITIDKNQELAFISDYYFKKSDKKITYINGNALDVLPTITTTFDLIFLDADKDNYPNYLEIIISKMHKGSVLLADNVLWKNKVIDAQEKDKNTKGIKLFNKKILSNSELEVVILPIRDGISIIRRK